MSNSYFCPHCKASLNPGAKLILRIRRKRRAGLALLSPQVGNYRTILPEDFPLAEGERAHFECPVCSADLLSPVSDGLCQVLRRDPDGNVLRVYFSRTYGEQATFVIHDEDVRFYGPDAAHYESTNFFGAGRLDRD